MTQPALAFPLKGLGRHYPWPPVDPSGFKRNRWKSVDPDQLPPRVTPLPSVTNVLDLLDKPGLRGWYAEHGIRAALAAGETDPDEAVKRHAWAANKVRDGRADQGTDAHNLMEQIARGEDLGGVPDELAGFAAAGRAFWDSYQPKPVHIETTVANPTVGYAGTADLFANFPWPHPEGLCVVDYKTRAGEPDDKKAAKYGLLYEANRLQLAALANCRFRMVWDGEAWVSKAIRRSVSAMGVVLYANGEFRTESMDYAALEAAFEAFEGLLVAWRWKNGAAA